MDAEGDKEVTVDLVETFFTNLNLSERPIFSS